MAASYNNIGNVYHSPGEYEEAEEYYQKDLDITVRLVVDLDITVRLVVEAKEYYQKDLDITVRLVGDHPDVAVSKVNIGLVFEAMGKKSEAKRMFSEAASIRRRERRVRRS